MCLNNDSTFGVKTSPRSLRHLWSLQISGESVPRNTLWEQSQCWTAKGRTKHWAVMGRYKHMSRAMGTTGPLSISHHWLSWIFDWHSLSKELWHHQLLPDVCCLLPSTAPAPAAEAAGANTCSCPRNSPSEPSCDSKGNSPSWEAGGYAWNGAAEVG